MKDKILRATKVIDKGASNTMDDVTYCVITGTLIQAEDELKALLYDKENDGRAEIAKNAIDDAIETLFRWYHYGEGVSLED